MSDGSTTWTFTYDAGGMRTQRTNGSRTDKYVYSGGLLMQMKRGTANTLDFTYDAAGRPTAVTLNGTLYYYITNLQGDITAIVDTTGATVVTYTYDAWGNILSTTGTLATTLGQYNPLRYRGYVYDQETGLYYLQSRYYDPEIGRFINADGLFSTGQGLLGNNMFAYCGNNPVMRVDPTGMCYYNANGEWCHDNWEYIGGYVRQPEPEKVAVLYDNRKNSIIPGVTGGFRKQGQELIKQLCYSYKVESYGFTTMEEFVESWQTLEGTYNRIYILSHGYEGGLSCNGQSISGTGEDTYAFWDLNYVSAGFVGLYSCNGATPTINGSCADHFAYLTGARVLAVALGSVEYYRGSYTVKRDGGWWTITYGNRVTYLES